jgi:hypothetical protein
MTDAECAAAGLPGLPDGVLPFESWEKLEKESSAAFDAFSRYRDYGPGRNMRRSAVSSLTENAVGPVDGGMVEKRYRMWRGWSVRFQWRVRAADYDRYADKLRQIELRKTIEEQGKNQRAFMGRMLLLADKRVASMSPAELTPGMLDTWINTMVRLNRELTDQEFAGLLTGGKPPEGPGDGKAGQIVFIPEFKGL